MRSRVPTLLTALLAAASLRAAEPPASPASMTYDQVLTTAKGVFVTKVWVKGDKKRTETDNNGQKEIDIIQGNAYYQIFPEQGFARKMSLALEGAASAVPTMDGTAKPVIDKGKESHTLQPLWTEPVSGLPCEVYQFRTESGVTKVWIHESLPFPLKWEEIDAKEGAFSYEVRNLRLGATIPDDSFELPAGIKVVNTSLDRLPPRPK